MRRQQHDTHASHREGQHQQIRTHANDEPRKRSYERVIDGERAFPDELTDEALPVVPVGPEAIEPKSTESKPPTAAEVDREVDQELAWQTGSSEAKYGSLKKQDTPPPR